MRSPWAKWKRRRARLVRQMQADDAAFDACQEVRRIAEEKGDQEALQYAEAARDEYPEAMFTHLIAAALHWRLRALAEAGECLAVLIALDPENVAAYRKLARLLHAQGRTRLAQVVLQREWEVSLDQGLVKDDEATRDTFFDLQREAPQRPPAGDEAQ